MAADYFPSKQPVFVRVCSGLITGASFLVPTSGRADWILEWQGEIYSSALHLKEKGNTSPSERAALIWRCTGAFSDAAWLLWDFLIASTTATSPEIWNGNLKFLATFLYGFLCLAHDLLLRISLQRYGNRSHAYYYSFLLSELF